MKENSRPPTSPAPTAAKAKPTSPAAAVATESALSVPAADGISAYGSSAKDKLTLRHSENPDAPRCSACGETAAPGHMSTSGENTDAGPQPDAQTYCSIRCCVALTLPRNRRRRFIQSWDAARKFHGAGRSDISRDRADLIIAGLLMQHEEEQRIAAHEAAKKKLEDTK